MSTATPTTQTLTPQEILQNLEQAYQETSRNLATVRESLTKSQESVIVAQDAAFKAYYLFSINKERHLINLISQHQQQNSQYTQELAKIKQLYSELLSRQVPTIQQSPSSVFLQSDSGLFPTSDTNGSRQDNLLIN